MLGQFIFVIELSVKKGREKCVFDGLALYVGSPELAYSNQHNIKSFSISPPKSGRFPPQLQKTKKR